jgi:hypothetical protein
MIGSASPPPEPTPLELPTDPYTKGASFESFEAAKDALLRHTVARGLSYRVLRSDKSRSCYLVSCLSSSCPFQIRFGLRRRHDNGRGTPEAHSNRRQARSVKSLRSRHQDRYRGDPTLTPEAARDHGPRAVQRESLLIQTGMAHPWRCSSLSVG